MKINKSNFQIVCSPQVMAKVLGFLNSEPADRYSYLFRSEWNPEPRKGELYLFRNGAKLCRFEYGQQGSRWNIVSYNQDRRDAKSAVLELEAGYALYTAVAKLKALEHLQSQAPSFCVTYRGLWGIYPSQQYTPSCLDYGRSRS